MENVGYMAFYVALFNFLIAEIAMNAEDVRFDFSTDYVHRNGMIPVHGKTFISHSSGRLAKFFLFSPGDTQMSRKLDPENGQSLSNFDPDLGTVIIIHGFLDSVSIAPWMHDMKNELLIYGDYNVIVVDWSSGNSIPYSRAAANTERVGQEISELLSVLINEYGARPEKFHLIGHSMGSHIAGFVGENIKGIGRITGLDPAGPRFENEDLSKRLDSSDALFVDVIHTDSGGIGVVEAIGHQDFYPNGGREQPGCTASNTLRALINEGVIEGVRNLICSHMRATTFFTASINNRNCEMAGVMCNSWEDFKEGKCVGCGASGERCAVMGLHAEPQRTRENTFQTYYFMTTPEVPFCAFEYRITFQVDGSRDSGGRLLGLRLSNLPVIGDRRLKLLAYGRHGTSEFEIDYRRFDISSENVTYVVPSSIYLGNINAAVAQWEQMKGARVFSAVTGRIMSAPLITKVEIAPLKGLYQFNSLENYVLCSRKTTSRVDEKTFRNSFC